MAQTRHCPNCGAEAGDLQAICLHCGRPLPGVWPPPPPAGEATLPPRPKTLTGRIWTDFLLGVLAQYLAHLAAARVLIRTIPAPNPANSYDFVGISRDWNRVSAILGVTLQEAAEAAVVGALVYFLVRRFFPVIARGSGYATLALLVVELGAFFTCHAVTY